MAFLLLGVGEDGEPELISSRSFESQREALEGLATLSAEPSFGYWDDVIKVIDLDSAPPVLLVRPAVGDAAPVDSMSVETIGTVPDEIDVQQSEPVGYGETEVKAPEPIVPDATDVQLPEPVGYAESGEGASEVDLPASAIPSGDLAEALRRTTEQMLSEGVVAPESVGPASVSSVAASWPWTDTLVTSSVDEPLDDAAEDVAQSAATETPGLVDESLSDITSEDIRLVLDGLEEPALDVTPIVMTPGDEDAFVSAAPVILGSYGTSAVFDGEPISSMETNESDTYVIPEITPAEQTDSDFILDMSEVVSELETDDAEELDVAAPDAPVKVPDAGSGSEEDTEDGVKSSLSCDDCVYVEPCPHKDERDPNSCGNFQWK